MCFLFGTHEQFDEDYFYERDDLTALYLKDTQLSCKFKNRGGEACSISIKLTLNNETGIKLSDHSIIQAKQIFIDSPNTELIIDESSYLDVRGRSRNDKGSDKNNAQGGSYVGQGGYCGRSAPSENYGSFDMLPNPKNIYDMKGMTLIGSAGHAFPLDTSTQGGGHIHLNIDSLTLENAGQQIMADGIPVLEKKDLPDDLNGGSGGYIYIKTANKLKPNSFSHGSSISASGGHGKNQGLGGAGGVIVLDGVFNPQDVRGVFYVNGGSSGPSFQDDCGAGAAGTIYFVK